MNIEKLIIQDKEIHVKKKQKQEFKLFGSMLIKRGLKLYEFDFDKMEIKLADVVDCKAVKFNGDVAERKKAFHNPKAYYFQSLNMKNAVRKANKIVLEMTGVEDYFKFDNGVIKRKVV